MVVLLKLNEGLIKNLINERKIKLNTPRGLNQETLLFELEDRDLNIEEYIENNKLVIEIEDICGGFSIEWSESKGELNRLIQNLQKIRKKLK